MSGISKFCSKFKKSLTTDAARLVEISSMTLQQAGFVAVM